jgi:hypothetical protein
MSKKATTKEKYLLLCPLAIAASSFQAFALTQTNTQPARMAPPNYPNTRARANWAVERATAFPEVWAIVARHRGVVGACQLMRVCRASRAGERSF